MAAKNEKDLSDQLRSSWLKAVAAIELRNFAYAIDLLQNLLRQEPEFLTGRQMLRRAEVTRAKTEKKGFFNISTAPLAVMKAQRELKKDPRKTIELVEKVLETGPYNSQANMLLKDAAVAANYPEIAAFLTRLGIDSISVNSDSVPRTLEVVHQAEQLLQLKKVV